MTPREKRTINAFINCVKTGQFTMDYAIILLEDNQRYGYLSQEAKDVFYEEFEPKPTVDELAQQILDEVPEAGM